MQLHGCIAFFVRTQRLIPFSNLHQITAPKILFVSSLSLERLKKIVLNYHFTRCPKLQQKLLGEKSLERRYELLIAALEKARCE